MFRGGGCGGGRGTGCGRMHDCDAQQPGIYFYEAIALPPGDRTR